MPRQASPHPAAWARALGTCRPGRRERTELGTRPGLRAAPAPAGSLPHHAWLATARPGLPACRTGVPCPGRSIVPRHPGVGRVSWAPPLAQVPRAWHPVCNPPGTARRACGDGEGWVTPGWHRALCHSTEVRPSDTRGDGTRWGKVHGGGTGGCPEGRGVGLRGPAWPLLTPRCSSPLSPQAVPGKSHGPS